MQGFQRLQRLAAGQPFVQHQPLVHVAAVLVRQQRRRMQVDLGGDAQRRGEVGLAAQPKRFDRRVQHRAVHGEAHFMYFA